MQLSRNTINESLRLANVHPWITRVAMQDIDIKGFKVPKGWKVFTMGHHLDTILLNHAKILDAQRWQIPQSDTESMPFGSGHRCCPGAELVPVLLAVFLHFIATKSRWKLLEDDELIPFSSAYLSGRSPYCRKTYE